MIAIISEELFFSLKKQLDGFVFWKREGSNYVVKQVCPNVRVTEILKRFPEYLK